MKGNLLFERKASPVSTQAYDPAFTCRPEPHIVVARLSAIHYEARLAGKDLAGGVVGIGTDPEMAVDELCRLDARAADLPYEIRDDPDE